LAAGPIIINEIMYDLSKEDCVADGSDDTHEWIEIKNISGNAVDLKNWKFNDGSNHLLNEPPKNGGQGSLIISVGGFAIFADDANVFLSDHPGFSGTVIDTVMSLNNTSDILKIIDADSQVIDEVSYDKSLGASHNCYTLERINDFAGQFCQSQNLGGSPGLVNNPNCSPSPTPTSNPTPTPTTNPSLSPTITSSPILTPTVTLLPTSSISPSPSVSPQKITVNLIINEFIPNPVGSDEENEWIEIYNAGDNEVDLSGWKIQDVSGKAYTFKEEKILAKNYLVLYRPKTKITINNDAETLSLIAPQGETASQISFSGGSKEGYSFARFGPNDWRWTEILTPGKENQFSTESQQKSFAASPSPSASLKIPYTNPESLGSFKKIVLPAIAIGAIFSLAALIFIKKFIP